MTELKIAEQPRAKNLYRTKILASFRFSLVHPLTPFRFWGRRQGKINFFVHAAAERERDGRITFCILYGTMSKLLANDVEALPTLPRLPNVGLAQTVRAEVVGEAEFLRRERDRRPKPLTA